MKFGPLPMKVFAPKKTAPMLTARMYLAEGRVPEQKTHLDLLQAHGLGQQMIAVVMLQRQEGVPDLVHVRPCQCRQIRAAVLHQVLHLPHHVGVQNDPNNALRKLR